MIDGEIYVRESSIKAIFAYRDAPQRTTSLTHYAAVLNGSTVYVCGVDGSCGCICRGNIRAATLEEIDLFETKLNENGYHYNKDNKKVIRISTGELI